ncbi:SLAC1 anion channel family protein [Cupriavidus lacunae]|uniref:C4-dicarboxylate ABC transporter n=1 Tax=Cupriavidus lacunae TaxID=2666307 RepID=A0A370NSP7_9BURK|nr:SLAC1 anion channel family protein [Cupriavidus lacunae]RDK08615.1 C4-dicarboxylate ABC transporter [Cupriavidus lacunae]
MGIKVVQSPQQSAPRGIESQQASVKNLPVSLFASVMGIAGLSLSWKLASHQFGIGTTVSALVGLLAEIVFVVLVIAYGVKTARYPEAVMNEFRHPVAGNFFGTVAIAMLLVSAVMGHATPRLAEVLWTLGSIAAIALAFSVIHRLFQGKLDPGHVLPAWLIPGVASLDIVVTGADMRMSWAHELNVFALAIGTVLALVFFTMIVSRIAHHERLPNHLVPSFMILIGPFEVGFLAYTNFTQDVDVFAAILFYFGLFLFFAMVFKVFRRGIPFGAGWWAIGFPLAALSSAALKYSATAHVWAISALAVFLLGFLSAVITVLFIRTLRLTFSGQLLAGK